MKALLISLLVTLGAMRVCADPLLNFSYGVLNELRGNQAEAVGFYQKAYEDDPSALHLVRMEAERLIATGDRSGALEIYQNAINSRSEEPLLNIEFGDFVGRIGKGDSLAEALRRDAYQKALEAYPGDLLPLERLIRLAREQGNDVRARRLLEALDLDSADAVLYFVSTTKSLYDSRDEGAGERIDDAFGVGVSLFPTRGDLARKASDHFKNSNRPERAIEVLAEHVEASPTSLDLKIRLGILLFAAERDEEGLQNLNEVLAVHPRKALAHETLAKYFRINGMEKKARGHAAAILDIRGGAAQDFQKLADELMEHGEFREARLLLEKAVFEHESDAQLYMKLAMATARDPETKEKAARIFQEAELMLEKSGTVEPTFILDSAKQLLAQGESAAAEDRLRTAIKAFPKDAKTQTAEALRALAEIWISEGRNLDAAKALIRRADTLEK